MAEIDRMLIDIELAAFEKLVARAYPTMPDDSKEWMRQLMRDGQRLCPNLLEVAVAKVGNLGHDATHGRDHPDGSDDKFATVRLGSKGKNYSAAIGNFKNKLGYLRIYVYERIQDKEYFFLVPFTAYDGLSHIEIPFYPESGYPKKGANVWWDKYQVNTFEDLSAAIPGKLKVTDRPDPKITQSTLVVHKAAHIRRKELLTDLFGLAE